MIIPRIVFDPSLDPDRLTDQLKHWSLLGQVALTRVGPNQSKQLEPVIQRIGGGVDLLIELTDPNEQDALDLLNAGATQILCSEQVQELDVLPNDRVAITLDDPSLDEAIPSGRVLSLSQPSPARAGELEMARIDCLIDVEQLTPEFLVEFFKLVLVTDRPDGLWSTVIVDPLGVALGLAYSNEESLLHALETRCGTYWSRSRDGLWIKGETSGATQQLLGLRMDCDRDCLRFMVTQDPPGFCHLNTHACFGPERTIQSVVQRLSDRIHDDDAKSFTRKLANDPTMLQKKLLEEAQELSDASQTGQHHQIAWEAADVLYFSLVAMLKNGVSLDQVHQELARRMNRVVRRDPGIKS